MIYLLTGPVHSGKTTFLTKVIRSLRENGVEVGGFLSVAVRKGSERTGYDANAVREKYAGQNDRVGYTEHIGYDLYDLRRQEFVPFIRKTGERAWQKTGPYFFLPLGLNRAKEILLETQGVDLLVVDEIGPLELSGRGLWPVLKDVISSYRKNKSGREGRVESRAGVGASGDCLLVVRDTVLEDFLEMVGGTEVSVAGASDIKVFRLQEEGVLARIMDELKDMGKR